jgi:hypothetical protein
MQMQLAPDSARDRTIARARLPVEPVIIAVLPLIFIFIYINRNLGRWKGDFGLKI